MKSLTEIPLIFLVMLAVLCIILAGSFALTAHQDEQDCNEWVGDNYVFDKHCYRLIDGRTYYVDITREKKIKEAQERMETQK